jgi:glycerol-3-phosphate dehydrogenase (NAD(P)+)
LSSASCPVGIIGAGAWGTALAATMASIHPKVLIWAREAEIADALNRTHRNAPFLPDLPLSPTIRATNDLTELAGCAALMLVTPAQFLRSVLAQLPPTNAALLLCAKGIEAGSQKLMSDVAAEVCPDNPLAVLSGPTFAHEVAAGKPTAITLACADEAQGQELVNLVATPIFRPYWTDDVIGAEIGGAVKNVLAIGCGVVDGAGLGLNARAALIARGFAEMQRYGRARGARAETLAGLSGLGDLVLTCSSESSRNFALGRGLGQGQSAAALLANRRSVAEGAATAPVLLASARALHVDMPIVAAVCALLDGQRSVDDIVRDLLGRPLRAEY